MDTWYAVSVVVGMKGITDCTKMGVYNRTADNKSGYAGVYHYKARDKYMVHVAGRYLGIFPTAESAYAARLEYIKLKQI